MRHAAEEMHAPGSYHWLHYSKVLRQCQDAKRGKHVLTFANRVWTKDDIAGMFIDTNARDDLDQVCFPHLLSTDASRRAGRLLT